MNPYTHISRIEFMVTYQCTGKCKHCSVGDALNGGGAARVDPAQAAKAVEALCALYPVTSIMTFGGEPLLYPDAVCAIHTAATSCGVDKRQLITNGYFTKDAGKRAGVARRLKDAGVNDVLLSVDAFHQETISMDAVHAFARDMLDAGLTTLRLHPAWVVDKEHDNPYNAATLAVLDAFGDLGIEISTGNNIFMAGNAATYLAQYYAAPQLNMADTCGSMPYTEPLTDIGSISIAPSGDVMVCGFAIGNIHEDAIADIVARYDPYANPCMRAILSGGAAALLDYAESIGVNVDIGRCYSVCDVCHAVAKHISNK